MNKILYDLTSIDQKRYKNIRFVYDSIQKIFNLVKNRKYGDAYKLINTTLKIIKKIKENARENKDEKSANISFLLIMYLGLLGATGKFWQLVDSLDYPNAWAFLQNALDYIYIIDDFIEKNNQFSVLIIKKYLKNIERLYPYVYFFSIEAINEKQICSICKKSPFDLECNHITGNLYMGEMAMIRIEKFSLLGISLVKNPVDKRCAVLKDYNKERIEKTPFKFVYYLVTHIKFPFRNFNLKLIKRKLPRSYYNSWQPDSLCPCNSKKSFKVCCYDKDFILNSHYMILDKGEITLN